MFRLTIEAADHRTTIEVAADRARRLLTDVLRGVKLPLNTRCGQRGLCDGCLVQLLAGELQDGETGAAVQRGDRHGMLRACRVRVPVSGAATIHVPARSLLAHQPQVVTSFRINVPRAQAPLWQPLIVDQQDEASAADPVAFLRRLAMKQLDTSLPIEVDTRWSGTSAPAATRPDLVVEHHGTHWRVTSRTVSVPAYGAAIDVGTTTVVVALVELATGRVVANAAALNKQIRLGDNVLTRINACMTKPHLVARFQHAVIDGTLNPLLRQAADEAGIALCQLACIVIAGNTTMLHLVAGIDPSPMGTAPFTPVFLEHRVDLSNRLGIDLDDGVPDAKSASNPVSLVSGEGDPGQIAPRPVHLLPGAAAYVGADITAGVLASGMAYDDRTCLLVDLGTNGELVLRHAGVLVGCATAAGPAFEGAGLTHGMRAGRGAISHIWVDEPEAPRVEVIDGGRPVGVCGTAYIDLLARGRAAGLLGATGRFEDVAGCRALIEHPTHGRALAVTHVADAEPLLITEADIATLLQAKAAIAAGIVCLLRRAQLEPPDIQTVYLAGGFGFHMHVDSLIGCGMLPGFERRQVEMVGNTALAGAYLALLDVGALDALQTVSRQMEIIELNLDPEFETTYIDQLYLPANT